MGECRATGLSRRYVLAKRTRSILDDAEPTRFDSSRPTTRELLLSRLIANAYTEQIGKSAFADRSKNDRRGSRFTNPNKKELKKEKRNREEREGRVFSRWEN